MNFHLKLVFQILKKTKDFHSTEFVHHGSLLKTNHGMYYQTVGIGVVKLKNEVFYVISQESPIGLLLKGKKVGEQLQPFNFKFQ